MVFVDILLDKYIEFLKEICYTKINHLTEKYLKIYFYSLSLFINSHILIAACINQVANPHSICS